MPLISIYRFIRLKIEDIRHCIWRKRLHQTDFTIISNNCWGGNKSIPWCDVQPPYSWIDHFSRGLFEILC